jgi:pilus assembly protein CpaF
MSAFGKRGGMSSGGRPSFGVAKPMKGGSGGASNAASTDGGEQFPPIEELDPPVETPEGEEPAGEATP